MGEVRTEQITIRPMREDDVREVMHIEMRSFPNPWTPLAFVTELRYNGDASYVVACDAEGTICGYIGWWTVDDDAAITHVAVAKNLRRRGLGMQLVDHATQQAAAEGATRMRLQVREQNQAARALYQAKGFQEEGRMPAYYDNPPDDAVVMTLSLSHRHEKRGDR